jgi:hypothetical protein
MFPQDLEGRLSLSARAPADVQDTVVLDFNLLAKVFAFRQERVMGTI